MDNMLTLADAARQFNIPHATLRRAAADERLKTLKVGNTRLVEIAEIQRYASEHHTRKGTHNANA